MYRSNCFAGFVLLSSVVCFKGFLFPLLEHRYWLFREANLEMGYPLELVDFGRDIPYDRVDTAIWWEPSGYTYLFQGDW